MITIAVGKNIVYIQYDGSKCSQQYNFISLNVFSKHWLVSLSLSNYFKTTIIIINVKTILTTIAPLSVASQSSHDDIS